MDIQEFFYSLLICFFLSFLIGIERQYRKRIIGLRTTILVSLGAFLFVNFSFSVGANDISRIASQVVTGIGFLGAGVILKDGKKVRGLTTAATLWCDAAIGTLCAGGAIKEAILGTIILLFANTILRYVNRFINSISNNKHLLCNYLLTIKGSQKEISEVKKEIQDFVKSNQIETQNLTIKRHLKDTELIFNFQISKDKDNKIDILVDKVNLGYKPASLELKKLGEITKEEYDEEI